MAVLLTGQVRASYLISINELGLTLSFQNFFIINLLVRNHFYAISISQLSISMDLFIAYFISSCFF